MTYDDGMIPEMVAGVRAHWNGLFQFGAPDAVVVNVTKNAIWTHKPALPESANFARPSKKEAVELFDLSLTKTTVDFPSPKRVVADIEGPVLRNAEFDAKGRCPPDGYRKPDPNWPRNFKIDVGKMVQDKIVQKVKEYLATTIDRRAEWQRCSMADARLRYFSNVPPIWSAGRVSEETGLERLATSLSGSCHPQDLLATSDVWPL